LLAAGRLFDTRASETDARCVAQVGGVGLAQRTLQPASGDHYGDRRLLDQVVRGGT
jgi:hypothetical protein